MVNSVAYCTQAVMTEAQAMAGVAAGATCAQRSRRAVQRRGVWKPICEATRREIRKQSGYEEIAAAVERLADGRLRACMHDLEDLERRLTALEDKMIAIARSRQTDDDLLRARRELDHQLRPYRGKMTAEQLAMLEKQYLERQLLESAGLPRLSLFYLR